MEEQKNKKKDVSENELTDFCQKNCFAFAKTSQKAFAKTGQSIHSLVPYFIRTSKSHLGLQKG